MDRRLKTQVINKILITQVIVLGILAALFFVLHGTEEALTAVFGGLIALGNTLLQKWRLFRAINIAPSDTKNDLSKVYRCMIERWIWTFIMFAIGFGLLKLTALALLTGFVITQGVLFFAHKY